MAKNKFPSPEQLGHSYFVEVFYNTGSSLEELKEKAIENLSDPALDSQSKKNIEKFIEEYKLFKEYEGKLAPEEDEERSICIGERGRRVDLKPR